MKNQFVAEILYQIADLLDLKGEIFFKTRAYRMAAQTIEVLDEDIDSDSRIIHNFKLKGKNYSLSRKNIFEAARSLDFPKAIQKYYVQLPDKSGKTQDLAVKDVIREALENK